MSTPKKRIRLSVADRRAQLLSHAQDLFAERSYDEVSIADVAAAAGVSPGLVFHYFESKRGLLLAAVSNAADTLFAATEAATVADQGDGSPAARLAALTAGLERYLEFVEARAFAFRFVYSSGLGGDTEVAAILRRTRERFADQIIEGRVEMAGTVGPPTPTLRYLALGWTSMVETVTLLWLDDQAVPRKQLAASLAVAAARLFGPPGA
ncbi:MAG: AcrR family transcriptional regulator [Myxococcota bacterium]|jgi:AcrR family transcriptional regulator